MSKRKKKFKPNRQQVLFWQTVVRSRMTQVALAEKLKCTPQFLSNILRGKANLPIDMWRQLMEEGLEHRLRIQRALVEDYKDKVHAELFE